MMWINRVIDSLVRKTAPYKGLRQGFLEAASMISKKDSEIDRLKEQLDKAHAEARIAKAKADRLEKDNAVLAERIPDIEKQLCNLNSSYDGRGQTVRVCVDIDYYMISRSLRHGDDNTVIRYMADSVGDRVYEGLINANSIRGI